MEKVKGNPGKRERGLGSDTWGRGREDATFNTGEASVSYGHTKDGLEALYWDSPQNQHTDLLLSAAL